MDGYFEGGKTRLLQLKKKKKKVLQIFMKVSSGGYGHVVTSKSEFLTGYERVQTCVVIW